jgi:uncharacterized protein involved in outer membrane biogenesis
MSGGVPPRKKMSTARWAAAIAAGSALIAVAMAGAAWWLIESLDLKQVVARVESAAEEISGRKVTIGAAPQLSFTPLLRLVVRDISLGNMEGGSRSEMLRVGQLEIGISLTPLLRGRRPGLNLSLVEPDLLLEVDVRGERNWALKLSPEEALARLKQAVAILDGKISLESARIERATVRFDDRSSGRRMAVTDGRAVLKLNQEGDHDLEIDAGLDGMPVTLRAGFRIPAAGQLMPARLRASLPGASLSAEGSVRPAWPAQGTDLKVALEINDAPRLGGVLGVGLKKLPVLRIDARLQGTNEGVRADPLQLTLGRSTLNGSIELPRFEPRPLVRATLDAPLLDLTEILAAAGAAREPSRADGRLFTATRLPLDPLRLLDLESSLRIGRLELPGMRTLERVQARVSLAEGRLRVDPFGLAAGPGRINGRLRLDAPDSRKTATVEAELHAKGVPLESLLAFVDLKAGIKGAPTDMAIKLASSGNSIRAWMSGLQGHARIVVGKGRLPGKVANWSGSVIGKAVDIANPYRTVEDGSALECVVVNVPVRSGIVSIRETIAGETDKVVGAVSGTVDLGQERLDLILHSQAVGRLGPGLADFASAAKVTGTLAKPHLAVNVQGTAVAGLRIGAAIATFGITEIAGSLARKAMPPHPCAAALGAKAAARDGSKEAAGTPDTSRKESGFFGRMLGK